VLVTGCSGRIGSAVAEALINKGHRVVGLDVSSPPKGSGGLVSFVQGNVFAKETLQKCFSAVQSFDAVIHLAATPDDADFEGQLLEPNIVGVSLLLAGRGTSFLTTMHA
jgi:nucleoside-diphosphate-sugar epimerase